MLAGVVRLKFIALLRNDTNSEPDTPVAVTAPGLGLLRNNPETKFYNPEKLAKKFNGITGFAAVRSSAAVLASGVHG
jgi:hypothetical protein